MTSLSRGLTQVNSRRGAYEAQSKLAAFGAVTAIVAWGVVSNASADPDGHGQGHEMAPTVPALKGMKVSLALQHGPEGVLVHAKTKRFKFAPADMAPDHENPWPHTPGEGHMHLYVDGKAKPATLLVGPWTYVALKPGKHRLRVTLNANTHAEYQRNGKPVEDSATIKLKR